MLWSWQISERFMNTDQLMTKFKNTVLWHNVHAHDHTESMFQFSEETKDLFSFQCLPKMNHIIAFNISLKNNLVTFKQVLKWVLCSCRSDKINTDDYLHSVVPFQ